MKDDFKEVKQLQKHIEIIERMMFAMANYTVDGKKIYPTLKVAKDALEKQVSKKAVSMTESEMYAKFRAEIEEMYAPLVLKECDEVIKITYDNQEVGLLCVKDKYIQGFYILPEHRRKGYGRRAILDYIKEYGMLKDLTILNTNDIAKAFWNSLFELEVVKSNSIDTYYKIKGVRAVEQCSI